MGRRERNTDPAFQTLVTDICVFAYRGRNGVVAAPSSVFLFYILAFLPLALIMKIKRNIQK